MDYTGNQKSPAMDSNDDSFEADRYTHVDRKLTEKLPKCLSKDSKCNFTNYFLSKKSNSNKDGNKSKVIRRRLSAYQVKAGVLYQSNSNSNNNVHNNNDDRGSTDRSTMKDKPSTYVLQAKVQHLLFEMKKIRQKDRELLKQFYTINDTIEELQWMFEEKEATLAKELMDEEVVESESEDDPYEKDMMALEDADVDVEEDENEEDEHYNVDDDDFHQCNDRSSEINTDTLDSGLTKSLSSLSLTNSSPTMSYQMSSASSRSHSPTESSMTSSLTRSSTKSPEEDDWKKTSITNQTYVPVEYTSHGKQTISYNNDTYDDVGGTLIANSAYDSLHGVDYVTRKKQLYGDSDSLVGHKKLHNSFSFTNNPTQMTTQDAGYISRRASDQSLFKKQTTTNNRLLKHPLAQSNQIHRSTSFQENTPSLQPWKYRFVPIDENRSSDVKSSNSTYDSRRPHDRYYQNVTSIPRQSQTLDRTHPQFESNIAKTKLSPNRRVSGTGSAGSLTSQSSSSDSSTSSLHSQRQREAELRNARGYRNNPSSMSRSYSVTLAGTKGMIYKRPLPTTNTSTYHWIRSQNDEVMYL